MPDTTGQRVEFTELFQEMVTDQAPRLFAIVLEHGDEADAEIIGWGMSLDEGAYVTTVDGSNQYVLTSAENALKYLRPRADVTPHLVWAAPTSGRPMQLHDLAKSLLYET
jgi:hypothetical protein